VPIPVWYCKKCNAVILPEKKDLPVDPEVDKPKKPCKCGSKEFEPEHDVFDTWMTSSMTPQIASRWLENPKLFKRLFPMSLRPQSHDIIRTWAFYTILKSFLHLKSIPWTDLMIGTYVLDEKGRGMHKSLGNVVWTHELLNKYNVDALRYWVSTAGVGEDLPFQEKELERGIRILIKLWNTARFVEMHLKSKPRKVNLEIIDKWILGRMYETLKNYHNFFKEYKPSKARKEIEMFFLHEFCDFYLEMVKYRLYRNKSADAARYVLYKCLLGILKMWAPFTPHITEEIYQQMFKKWEKDTSIHISGFPKIEKIDKKAVELGKFATEAIAEIRKWKAEKNMSVGAQVEKLILYHPRFDKLKMVEEDIKGTMRIEKLELKKGSLKVL